MKRLLTIVITLSVMQSLAFASFPDTWNGVFFHNPISADDIPHAMYYTFYLSGDTTISDLTYQKLYIDGEYPACSNFTNQHIANIRVSTNGNQVYLQTNDNEYLLFDFSVNEGDTCHVYYGIDAIFGNNRYYFHNNDSVRDLVVLSINKGPGGCRMITLGDLTNPSFCMYQTTWIEGVGSTLGLTSFPYDGGGVTSPILLCASRNGQQIYMAPDDLLAEYHYKNACPRVDVATDLSGLTNGIKVSSPCYTILGTLAGDDYRGVVIQNGKIFIKQ